MIEQKNCQSRITTAKNLEYIVTTRHGCTSTYSIERVRLQYRHTTLHNAFCSNLNMSNRIFFSIIYWVPRNCCKHRQNQWKGETETPPTLLPKGQLPYCALIEKTSFVPCRSFCSRSHSFGFHTNNRSSNQMQNRNHHTWMPPGARAGATQTRKEIGSYTTLFAAPVRLGLVDQIQSHRVPPWFEIKLFNHVARRGSR